MGGSRERLGAKEVRTRTALTLGRVAVEGLAVDPAAAPERAEVTPMAPTVDSMEVVVVVLVEKDPRLTTTSLNQIARMMMTMIIIPTPIAAVVVVVVVVQLIAIARRLTTKLWV